MSRPPSPDSHNSLSEIPVRFKTDTERDENPANQNACRTETGGLALSCKTIDHTPNKMNSMPDVRGLRG